MVVPVAAAQAKEILLVTTELPIQEAVEVGEETLEHI
jgi:hypothetical protein